ncbi:Acg family FMN-binding oxidoreductase [Nonomuraea sp. 10N515B]|uniref:Acg family FMN-binding oxidoreductase n=1 Tax=Nonomuraea sp. 10N515B TaxID=3457422 RepID=UPI003FCEE595
MTTAHHTIDLAVRRLLVAAGEAPSVHNTQPWRFEVRGDDVFELLSDWDRWLPVSDPRGRSLHVSCGAALFNLRIAARAAGRRPDVRLLPDPEKAPDLLATVDLEARGLPTAEAREMYDLIPVRRTNRMPYDERLIPAHVLSALRTAASMERARLILLDRRSADDMLDYAALAQDELARDSKYVAELAAWTSGHGVPSYVHGPLADGVVDPIRDFGRRACSARFEPRPQLAVLTTAGDEPMDWLRAGQALERVLLVAARHGVSASFLNQPLDLRDMRRHSDPHHRRGHPQMIMRLGYGPIAPRAPRRPVSELLVEHTGRTAQRHGSSAPARGDTSAMR